eukprot:sb/3476467/
MCAERPDVYQHLVEWEDNKWETSKQPIRTRCLGHVTGYQPIRDHYFLIRSNSNCCQVELQNLPSISSTGFTSGVELMVPMDSVSDPPTASVESGVPGIPSPPESDPLFRQKGIRILV